MLNKYVVFYFEIDLGNKKIMTRRILEDNKLRWEYVNDSRMWTKCDEKYRVELRPSKLEGDYQTYMRTQKLERVLNEE